MTLSYLTHKQTSETESCYWKCSGKFNKARQTTPRPIRNKDGDHVPFYTWIWSTPQVRHSSHLHLVYMQKTSNVTLQLISTLYLLENNIESKIKRWNR